MALHGHLIIAHGQKGLNPNDGNSNFEILGNKINITPNFKGVNCNLILIKRRGSL